MKFAVPQQQLVHGLAIIGRTVSSRAILPVLTGVFLEAGDGNLRLVGSDNETWVELSMPATVAAAGSLVIPARYLTELVRRIPPEDVAASADLARRSLHLSWSRGRLAVHGYDPAEFPLTPEAAPSSTFELPRDRFRRLIRQTAFAVSSDATRVVFTGTLLTREDGQLAMVATDGFRLARAACPLPAGTAEGLGAILPGRVLGELAAMLEGDGPPVRIGIGKALASFESGPLKVVARILEGQFPPYRQVIPREFRTTARLSRTAFEEASDLALAALRESGQAMRMELTGEAIRLEANAPERGELEGEIAARIEGEPLKVAFNPRYLLEGLKVLDGEEILCRFTGPSGPACLQAEGDEGFLYVVLPVRLE